MTVRDEVGEQLAGWGKVARLVTRGRSSGRPSVAAVGFAEEDDGSLLIAAGSPGASWARDLDVEPTCDVTIGDRTTTMVAESLAPPDAARAVVALILKYGTPAERLGRGPAYRLRQVPRR